MAEIQRGQFRYSGPRGLRVIVPMVVLAIFFFGRDYFWSESPPTRFDAEPIPAETIAGETVEVERVVDGDTLIVLLPDDAGGEPSRERLRLLGIDTPETVKEDTPVEAWGPEATAFTKDFLSGGRARLEFDKRKVDQFGRYLAYVYVGDRMLNEALVAEGLARVSHFPGDSEAKVRILRKAEEAAKAEGKGMWSDSR